MNNHSILNSAGLICLAGYTKLKIDDIEKKIDLIQKQNGIPQVPQTRATSSVDEVAVKKLQKENNVIASILVNMKETNDRLAEEISLLKKKVRTLESGNSSEPVMVNEEQECDENDYLELLKQIESETE